MKTNFDFLDTGSFLYILIAVCVVAFVVWSFLYEAIKPLFALFKKTPTPKPRVLHSTRKERETKQWRPDRSPNFEFGETDYKTG